MTSTETPMRRAVVTGASSGIGRAVALELAQRGFSVYAIARTEAALEELAGVVLPGSIMGVPLDIGTPDACVLEQALAAIEGPLDALVHAAGTITTGSLENLDAEEMLRILGTNAVAPLRLTKRLIPMMRRTGSSIIFMNSSQGRSATSMRGVYAASKHALKGAADALRSDLSGRGIRVTSVYLGRTATPMQERLYAERHETYLPERLLQPGTIADLVHAVISLPLEAEVTDLNVRPAMR